jgi:hypothetical protein
MSDILKNPFAALLIWRTGYETGKAMGAAWPRFHKVQPKVCITYGAPLMSGCTRMFMNCGYCVASFENSALEREYLSRRYYVWLPPAAEFLRGVAFSGRIFIPENAML